MTVTRAVHYNKLYLTTTHRGTEYCLIRAGESWYVATRRLALGRSNIGGGKLYATLADVAAGCKAFGSVEEVTALVYGLTTETA